MQSIKKLTLGSTHLVSVLLPHSYWKENNKQTCVQDRVQLLSQYTHTDQEGLL